MWLALVLLVVLLALYVFIIRTWSHFTDRNVRFERGYPMLGTLARTIIGRTSCAEDLIRIYNKYPNERFVGMYEIGGAPSVMVLDPELIKSISIKDFDSFVNHNFQVDTDIDPIMSRVMFISKDQKWRDIRSVFSPMFTGSKMRMMLTLMAESIETNFNYLRQQIVQQNPSGQSLEYNVNDIFSACANDVIATCAFGLRVNSMKDKENDYFVAGKAISYAVQSMKALAVSSMPRLAKFFRIKVIDPKYDEFFRNAIRDNVKQRKERNIVRNDMIHLMLLAQQGKLDEKENDEYSDAGFATIAEEITKRAVHKVRDLDEDDFAAQCFIFFLAGFTTISITMSFLCHELAMNTGIQDRLRQEIDDTHQSLDGKTLTYEALQKMSYLDQVISEVLRKWPVGVFMDRKTNKQYLLENNDGTKLLLQPNDTLWFPVFAIHRDPKYYPEPDKFDPERFSAENKKFINPNVYLPFGLGPRSCIGTRFALMELKALTYYLVRNFYVECGAKTDVPLQLKTGSLALDAAKGYWLQLRIRNSSK